MALTYNTNIFTQVSKWDKDGNPYGILVSGKLNQYNKQGYPILDAIDIDWNGAYIKNLNCYLYTTEDLINAFNLTYSNFSNYTTYSYFGQTVGLIDERITYINNKFSKQVDDTYRYMETVNEYLRSLNLSIDYVRYLTLDNISFFNVKYEEIVDEEKHKLKFKDKQYYLYDEDSYEYYPVSEYYVINNPRSNYYMNAVTNILANMENIENINDFIGESIYDEDNDTYTYTGLIEKLHNYDKDFEDIHEQLTYTSKKAISAYELASSAYSYIDNLSHQVILNRDNIGVHTSYNIYIPISQLSKNELDNYLALNDNKIYYDDNGEYKITSYNQYYNGEYYAHYNKKIGSGIEREIELLDDKIYDNSYLLYKLHTQNKSIDYSSFNIKPINPGDQERIIEFELNISNVNSNSGDASKGLITNNGLTNSFTYMFSWEILNKE